MSLATATLIGRAPRQAQARSFLPPGLRLRGANVTVKPAQAAHPTTGWLEMYQEWDWSGWIKPQVDRAVALGCNAVRMMGDPTGILNGTYTRAVYLERQRQFIEYAASRNLWVYAQGSALSNMGPTPNYAAIAPEIAAYAAFCSRYSNVFAIDCLNEVDSIAGLTTPTVTDGLDLIAAAVRAAAPNLPLTFSIASGGGFSSNISTIGALAPRVDFYDGHYYGNATSFAPSFNLLCQQMLGDTSGPIGDSAWLKPIISGEFGIPFSETTADRKLFYQRMRDNAHLHPQSMGSFCWAMADQRDTTFAPNGGTFVGKAGGDSWGVFDNTGAYRADVGDTFKTFPTTSHAPQIVILESLVDTTIAAPLALTYVDVVSQFLYSIPVHARARFHADLEVVTAGNRYDAALIINGADAVLYGPNTPSARLGVGPQVGRQVVTGGWDAIFPAGSLPNVRLQVGHTLGSAADGIAHGATGVIRAVLAITAA